MSNVIGPIDMATFYTMTMLRQNIREMQSFNDESYGTAITGQKRILKDLIKESANKLAA